jgi:hypothetical protein
MYLFIYLPRQVGGLKYNHVNNVILFYVFFSRLICFELVPNGTFLKCENIKEGIFVT